MIIMDRSADQDNLDFVVTILRSQIAILDLVKACAGSEGLTMQQFGVLRLLSLKGPLPMIALSEELKVSPPVITGIIDRLEKKSSVRRKETPADRRMTEIVLTDAGKRLYRKIQTDYRRSLQDSLAKSLTPGEQETLASLLRRVAREIPSRQK
jgi:DNA-binding MarR family transcriptional regulator